MENKASRMSKTWEYCHYDYVLEPPRSLNCRTTWRDVVKLQLLNQSEITFSRNYPTSSLLKTQWTINIKYNRFFKLYKYYTIRSYIICSKTSCWHSSISWTRHDMIVRSCSSWLISIITGMLLFFLLFLMLVNIYWGAKEKRILKVGI